MRFIGIDPGISGAIAVLDDDEQVLHVLDMPIIARGKTGRRKVNAPELARRLDDIIKHSPARAVIEQVSAMPGQGVSSMFGFGHSLGVLEGICAALMVRVDLVTPGRWKRLYGLVGAEKDANRSKATSLWPQAPLARKKDSGRADALLLAGYCYRQHRGGGV